MTATIRRNAPTSGQVGPKLRVWGAPQQAEFLQIFAKRKFVKTCKCRDTCPACRLVDV